MKKDKCFLTIPDKNNSYLLTPWQSESIVSKTNGEQNQNHRTIDKGEEHTNMAHRRSIFPRVSPKLTVYNRQEKVSLRLPKKEIIVDEKSQRTFQLIRKAKQTSFNGFITKYKNEQKQSKRYFLASNLKFFSINQEIRSMNGGDKVKTIDLSSAMPNKDENIEINKEGHYVTKQVEFSRKRSLSNFIKDLNSQKYFKVKAPYRNSPWMMTTRMSMENVQQIEKDNSQKMKKNMKLVELNLDIRQRNFNKFSPKK